MKSIWYHWLDENNVLHITNNLTDDVLKKVSKYGVFAGWVKPEGENVVEE